MSEQKKRTYRRHDKEFKLQAAKLVVEQGMSRAEVGRNLGVNPNLVGKWVEQYRVGGGESFPGRGKLPPDEARLRELERENKRLSMQVEILRKATAYFAQLQK